MTDDDWCNHWGMMKLANFRVGKSLRVVRIDELPTDSERYSAQFLAALREFTQQVLPTDTLYYYDADQSEWDKGFGSEGYVLVRDGELITELLLRMN